MNLFGIPTFQGHRRQVISQSRQIRHLKLRPGTPVPSVKPEMKTEAKVEERKEPGASVSISIPLALKRIHDKLSSPTELLKLHLKHDQMSTEKFKRRTSALKIPASIYELYEKVTKQCETCQKQKVAHSRVKVSGIRSETFGELTFADHGEVTVSTAVLPLNSLF